MNTKSNPATFHTSKQRSRLFMYLHSPRKFLLAIMSVAFVSVLGIGLVAGLQSMNQSTEDRSQADGHPAGSLYFDPAVVNLPAGTTNVDQAIKIVAGRSVGVVAFAVSYNPTQIPSVSYNPNVPIDPDYPSAAYDLRQETVQVSPTLWKTYFVQAVHVPYEGKRGYYLGTLRYIVAPNFQGQTTINFLPTSSENPGLNQVVMFGQPGAGALTPVSIGAPLRINVGTAPTATPPVAPLFPGVPSTGRLWYCEAETGESCSDSTSEPPVWQPAAAPVNGQISVPVGATQLRYRISNDVQNTPPGWKTMMRAEVPASQVKVLESTEITAGSISSPLGAANWPVVMGTNYVQAVAGYAFTCTIREAGNNLKQYVYRPIGSSEEGLPAGPDGTCLNNTKVTVIRQSDPTQTPTPTSTVTPTASPTPSLTVTPTLSPTRTPTPSLTPTPTPGSGGTQVLCPIPGPVGIRPSLVRATVGDRTVFQIKWKNILAGTSGKYGVYLISAGTGIPPTPPEGSSKYYLYDIVNQNTEFTVNSNGTLNDPTLSPASSFTSSDDYSTFTWFVPTDSRTDRLGLVVKDRPFYRFLVYALHNDGSRTCSNQAAINRWPPL